MVMKIILAEEVVGLVKSPLRLKYIFPSFNSSAAERIDYHGYLSFLWLETP